jgi:antitoxin component YwqK of YwqJK toxin-antitoxin module
MTAQVNQYDSQNRPHGVWEWYWADGTLWQRAHYHHGKLHGIWEYYFTDGIPYFKKYFLTIK